MSASRLMSPNSELNRPWIVLRLPWCLDVLVLAVLVVVLSLRTSPLRCMSLVSVRTLATTWRRFAGWAMATLKARFRLPAGLPGPKRCFALNGLERMGCAPRLVAT